MARKLAAVVMILVVAGLCAFLYYYTKSPSKVEINNSGTSKGLFGYNSFTIDESGELAVDEVNSLNISGISADITVRYEDSDVIKAHFYGNLSLLAGSPEPHLTITKDGGTAKIEVEPRSVTTYRIGTGSLKLDVIVPLSLKASLAVQGVSGSIVLMGDVDVDSIDLNTVSGSISSGKAAVQRVFDVNTVSGSIDIDDVTASSYTINSISGSVTASKVIGANVIKLGSISGRISLGLPSDAQFDISASSVSGKVSCAFPVIIESSTDKKLVGRVGNGKTNIDITTVSGSISIESR